MTRCPRVLLLAVALLACFLVSASAQRCKGGSVGSFMEMSQSIRVGGKLTSLTAARDPPAGCFSCIPVCWTDATTRRIACNLMDADSQGKFDTRLCVNAVPNSMRPSGKLSVRCEAADQIGQSTATNAQKVLQRKLALNNLARAVTASGKPTNPQFLNQLSSMPTNTPAQWQAAVAMAQHLGANVNMQPLGDHFLICGLLTASNRSEDVWCWETPPALKGGQYLTGMTSLNPNARPPSPPRFAARARNAPLQP